MHVQPSIQVAKVNHCTVQIQTGIASAGYAGYFFGYHLRGLFDGGLKAGNAIKMQGFNA